MGVYVPGGTAVLPSSALMLCTPAGIAGCQTIVMATPPRPDGSVTPEVLYCARKAGDGPGCTKIRAGVPPRVKEALRRWKNGA